MASIENEEKLMSGLPISEEGIKELAKRLLKEIYGKDYEIFGSGKPEMWHTPEYETSRIDYVFIAEDVNFADVYVTEENIFITARNYYKVWSIDEDGKKYYDLHPYDDYDLTEEEIRENNKTLDLSSDSSAFVKQCFEEIDKEAVPFRKANDEITDLIDKAYKRHDFAGLFDAKYRMAELKKEDTSVYDILAATAHMISPNLSKTGINKDDKNSRVVGNEKDTYIFYKQKGKFGQESFQIRVPEMESFTDMYGAKGTQYRMVTVFSGLAGNKMKELPDHYIHYDRHHIKTYTQEGLDKMIELCEDYAYIPDLKMQLEANPIKDTGELNRDRLEVEPDSDAFIFSQPDLLYRGLELSDEAKNEFKDYLDDKDLDPEDPSYDKDLEKAEFDYFMEIINELAEKGDIWGEISLDENDEPRIIVRGEDDLLIFNEKPIDLSPTEKELIMSQVGDKVREAIGREDYE